VRGVVSACSCRPRCSVGDDHDSAAGDVGFHRRMRLDVSFRSKTRPVRTAASRPPPARGAPAAASPGKWSPRPSRREGDARRDDSHRREVSERTAVTDHARRAYDPRLSHRRDRVRQRRRAYQLEHLVGAVRQVRRTAFANAPSSRKKWSAPPPHTDASPVRWREVAATCAPSVRAMAGAARPIEVVPPRISSRMSGAGPLKSSFLFRPLQRPRSSKS